MGRESLTEGGQAEEGKCHMIHVESRKKGTNELIYKTVADVKSTIIRG